MQARILYGRCYYVYTETTELRRSKTNTPNKKFRKLLTLLLYNIIMHSHKRIGRNIERISLESRRAHQTQIENTAIYYIAVILPFDCYFVLIYKILRY